jgi:hypothetical protein
VVAAYKLTTRPYIGLRFQHNHVRYGNHVIETVDMLTVKSVSVETLVLWTTIMTRITVASILGVGGRDPQMKWGSWRVWFLVFYAVKGRDGNPGPQVFKLD